MTEKLSVVPEPSHFRARPLCRAPYTVPNPPIAAFNAARHGIRPVGTNDVAKCSRFSWRATAYTGPASPDMDPTASHEMGQALKQPTKSWIVAVGPLQHTITDREKPRRISAVSAVLDLQKNASAPDE